MRTVSVARIVYGTVMLALWVYYIARVQIGQRGGGGGIREGAEGCQLVSYRRVGGV